MKNYDIRPEVVGSGDVSIDVFLEVQDQRYSKLLYLIDYIACEPHLLYNS